jgi:hypothetical protein
MNRPRTITPASRSRQRRCGRCLPAALACALTCALVLAACGGSSKPSSASARKGSPPSYEKAQLAAAKCIRSHGVPNVPDPTFGAGGAQVNLHAPLGMMTSAAFQLAQKECAKRGLELAGYAAMSVRPDAATMAQWLTVARCMRAHGVSHFPDPATTMPPDPATYPARYLSVGDMNGVIFAIPKSIDPHAPAVKNAAAACNGQALIATG